MEGCKISESQSEAIEKTEISGERPEVFAVKVPNRSRTKLLFLIRLRTNIKDLPIYSAFLNEDQEGLVFVEAENKNAVVEAVRGFRYASVLSEPVKPERVDSYLEAFKVKYKEKPKEEEQVLNVGTIVKVVKGPFSGTKARVVSVREDKVWVDLGGGGGGGAQLVEIKAESVRPISPESI